MECPRSLCDGQRLRCLDQSGISGKVFVVGEVGARWQVAGLGIDFELRLVCEYPIEELERLCCMLRSSGDRENIAAAEGGNLTLVRPGKERNTEVKLRGFFLQHSNRVVGTSLHSNFSGSEDFHSVILAEIRLGIFRNQTFL